MKEVTIGLTAFAYVMFILWAGGMEFVRSPDLASSLVFATILGVGVGVSALIVRRSV